MLQIHTVLVRDIIMSFHGARLNHSRNRDHCIHSVNDCRVSCDRPATPRRSHTPASPRHERTPTASRAPPGIDAYRPPDGESGPAHYCVVSLEPQPLQRSAYWSCRKAGRRGERDVGDAVERSCEELQRRARLGRQAQRISHLRDTKYGELDGADARTVAIPATQPHAPDPARQTR